MTDIFVRRPVLSVVVSLFILLAGLLAEQLLPVRQYPKTVNAVIEVDTSYYGADANTMAGFITTPLENAMSQVDGIDYLVSQSLTGLSEVTAHLRLNEDPDRVLTEIQTQISAVHDELPRDAQTPSIHLQVGSNGNTMILAFRSPIMTPTEISDYLQRVVLPQLQSTPGVQLAQIWGEKHFAVRAWLDPVKLAAHGMTAADVSAALAANNFSSAAGQTAGQMTTISLGITTSLHTIAGFRKLVVKQANGAIVRLGDVADVELGSSNYRNSLRFDGKTAVLVDIEPVPNANVLDLIGRLRTRYDSIRANLPQGLHTEIAYDVTENVRASIKEVVKTLLESLAIVTLVVYAFLRRARASLIPVITIPLSLIGTFALLWAMGFSINLLTLLALVLATGLVVDDAIIVVENVSREMGEGTPPVEAALRSARSLAGPIIAMTVVLIAVYVPIALRSGLTGALFREFALTLVGSVTVSAVLALSLSPMMCAVLLRQERRRGDRKPPLMQRVYRPMLRAALRLRPLVVALGLAVFAGSYFLYVGATSELAPQEDDGQISIGGSTPPTANIDQLRLYQDQIGGIMRGVKEGGRSYMFAGPGEFGGALILKDRSQRSISSSAFLPRFQAKLSTIAGADIAAFLNSALPGSDGDMPVGYVIKTTRPFSELDGVSENFLAEAKKSGIFAFVDRDLKLDLPQATVVVDRDKVASLGLDMSQIGAVLNGLLSGGYVNYFDMAGRSYRVVPEIARDQRLNPEQLGSYIVANVGGVPIPLSSVAHIKYSVVPEQISHFQQMNSATISGVTLPGISQGRTLQVLDGIAARVLPPDYATDTAGQLRQFVHESSGFATTFLFAAVVIYLSLAALFGSFRDPLIILVSVPMSLAGALLFIRFGVHGATLNIYSEVGLVTLMGLISKHGILMVEVANERQEAGDTKRAAIEHAALLRLRPILMTTAAMVLGVAPLVFASGAGAAARFNMGLVIASGLSIGTLFTLFVVPAFYMVLARTHRPEVARRSAQARGLAVASE